MEDSQNVKISPMFKLPETAISGKFMMTKNVIAEKNPLSTDSNQFWNSMNTKVANTLQVIDDAIDRLQEMLKSQEQAKGNLVGTKGLKKLKIILLSVLMPVRSP